MGVRGLWKVLEPAGRPVASPEALSGQRVAIDASIWIYQFLRVTSPGANHNSLILAGLFRRLCKLLYFNIRPVLVFDGAAPTLKRETTRDRAFKRGVAEERYRRIARKIVAAQMHINTLKGGGRTGRKKPSLGKRNNPEDSFDNLDLIREEDLHQSESEDSEELPSHQVDEAYLADLDADSPDFKDLPPDVQQEVLIAKKDHILQRHLGLVRGDERRIPALHFSSMQVEALVKRRKVSEHLEKIKEGSIMDFEKDYLARGGGEPATEQKIASDSTRTYVLVKNSKKDGGGWTIDASAGARKDGEREEAAEPSLTAEDDFDGLFGESSKGNDDFVIDTLVGKLNKDVTVEDSTKDGVEQLGELSFQPEIYLKVEPAASAALTAEKTSQKKVDKKRLPPANPRKNLPISIEEDKVDMSFTVEEAVPARNEGQDVDEMPGRQECTHDLIESEEEKEDAEVCREIFTTSPLPGSSLEPAHDHLEIIERLKADIDSMRGEVGNQAHSTSIDSELLEDFRTLLTIMGIPWLVAPGEAEAQCAWLQSQGHVDSIITDDNDVLLFGGSRVYRHFFIQKQKVSLFLARDVERELGLDRGLLIVMALLLGSDYCVGVKGMGPVKSMQLTKTLKSLPSFKAASPKEWIDVIAEGLVEHRWPASATHCPETMQILNRLSVHCALPNRSCLDERVAAAYLNPLIDDTLPNFSWRLLSDLTSLGQFLRARLGWDEAECKKVLEPIILRQMSVPKPTQTTLDAFLSK